MAFLVINFAPFLWPPCVMFAIVHGVRACIFVVNDGNDGRNYDVQRMVDSGLLCKRSLRSCRKLGTSQDLVRLDNAVT